jgi:hypothetical protein
MSVAGAGSAFARSTGHRIAQRLAGCKVE